MMNRYFFILGKNPYLSLSEIIAYINQSKTNPTIIIYSPETLVVDIPRELEIDKAIKALGGTIKIGKIIDSVNFDEDEKKFEEIFNPENLVSKYFPKISKKVSFGTSVYNGGGNPLYVAQLLKKIRDINITIKENLQEKGIKSGFLRIKERFLSSVSVFKNKLLTSGAEIVFIIDKDKIMIGKTWAVQEFASFSFRDYGRPKRNKKSGIMPPKLARMMINLSQATKETTLLDPFCGSGTILQEAIILGYKNIIGADVTEKAVSDTNINLQWLFQNYLSIERENIKLKIFPQDVQTISQTISSNSIDVIVTEPFLGPPLYQKPEISKIKNIISQVSPLYSSAFRQFAKILKSGGKVVIIFPAFIEKNQLYCIEILEDLKRIGFELVNYLPTEITRDLTTFISKRNTVLYGGSDYFVQREILIFRKI